MSSVIDFDPWLKSDSAHKALPENARLVCRYVIIDGFIDLDEAVYLAEAGDGIDFWVRVGDDLGPLTEGRLGRVVGQSDETDAARVLLDALFRARVGFISPQELQEPGVISEAAYKAVLAGLTSDLRRNADQAEAARGTPIIRRAQRLGLNPGPTGTGPDAWSARCPETSHRLMISATRNRFGCGWCRRSGDADELELFANERKARRAR